MKKSIEYLIVKKEQSFKLTNDDYEVTLEQNSVHRIVDYDKLSNYYTTNITLPVINIGGDFITLQKDSYILLKPEELGIHKLDVIITSEFKCYPVIEDSTVYNKDGFVLKIGNEVFVEGFVIDDDKLIPYFNINSTRYQLDKEKIISSLILDSFLQDEIKYEY